jgi:outer membrane protein OmpA-like peptidoglycan-associated protein/tetratricopeptide (TPR) repeat protein
MKKALLFLLLFLPLLSISQSRKVWLYEADVFYEAEDYYNALLNYEKALSDTVGLNELTIPYEVTLAKLSLENQNQKQELDSAKTVPLRDYIEHQIASCHMETYDYKEAADHFEVTSSFNSYPEDVYYYGVAQMNLGNYEGAIKQFEAYIGSDNYSDEYLDKAHTLITGCYYALEGLQTSKKITVEIADTTVFNKGTASFAPAYFGDEDRLMFTSAREGGVVLDPEKQDSRFLCDLYWTERDADGNWQAAKNFGRPLNSSRHDGSAVFNSLKRNEQQSLIYFTKWSDENRKEQSIYRGRMVNMLFFESFKLPESVNVPGYKSINPFVSLDETKLYFSSNRPGGSGGMDLWFIDLDEDGQVVGEAINLGNSINTDLDEVTPFFHEASSTLFFSSNGLNSIGGLDIFKSRYNKENQAFSRPENMGEPINSSMDDSYLVWDGLLQKGFFASDRADCENGHCYNIYEINNAPFVITIEGLVFDIDTDEIIPEATVSIKSVEGKFDEVKIKTDENGFYSTELMVNEEYFLKGSKKGYFADAGIKNTLGIVKTSKLMQDFYLTKIPTGEIEIKGIEYDFDAATLRPQSKIELDKLVKFLELNSNLKIEIRSHTDERGSNNYNQKLSQRRAQSVVDYLVDKGVSIDRLDANGLGEAEPAIVQEDGEDLELTPEFINSLQEEEKREEYHQRNRRTAFKVKAQ